MEGVSSYVPFPSTTLLEIPTHSFAYVSKTKVEGRLYFSVQSSGKELKWKRE